MSTAEQYGFYESDWRLFRKKLPDWQEDYMDRLTKEYVQLLSSKDKHSYEKFWELDKRIKADKRKTGVLARDISRSNMFWLILDLLHDGAIGMSDLDDFSDLFKNELNDLLAPYKWKPKP
ncbi:MAG: multidrug transporter [Erysipelotrichaceae bacterium]|nr:multidrug transporter [Erysipelotrichaceae bacterium]